MNDVNQSTLAASSSRSADTTPLKIGLCSERALAVRSAGGKPALNTQRARIRTGTLEKSSPHQIWFHPILVV